MIPVLIAPLYNRPDLLERMLASVTVPVERGLVIDNGMTGYRVPESCGPEWKVAAPPFTSYGYPGSLNFGIMQTPDAPWWMWASNDVVFGHDDLVEWARLMADPAPLVVSWHFAAGALNRAAVQAVGLFDEWSFWPLYFDDTDYARRCKLAGVTLTHYFSDTMSEGADGHATSMTIHSDPALATANAKTWAINHAAYVAKWGGPPGQETFDSPWDSGLPVWATRPDLDARCARMWP